MTDTILCACASCGKEFAPRNGKANKYCGLPCYRVAQRAGECKRGHGPEFPRAPCFRCGAEVLRRYSQRRNGQASDKVFCDRRCYTEFCKENNWHPAVGQGGGQRSPDVSVACAGCGSQFFMRSYESRRYCSESCWKSSKKAKPKNCVNCGCLFTPVKRHPTGRMISHSAGKTCSADCANQWIRNNPERKRKIGLAFSGDRHPNWQGGKALLNNLSNRGPNWNKQRAAAIKRDRACVDCGISNDECRVKYGRCLDVDHVVPFHNFTDYRKANALRNLECRCASCHRIAEAKRDCAQMVLHLQDSEKRRHKGRARGEKINTAKLCEYDVRRIRVRAAAGETAREIWRDYLLVTQSAVAAIIRRKTWRHVS